MKQFAYALNLLLFEAICTLAALLGHQCLPPERSDTSIVTSYSIPTAACNFIAQDHSVGSQEDCSCPTSSFAPSRKKKPFLTGKARQNWVCNAPRGQSMRPGQASHEQMSQWSGLEIEAGGMIWSYRRTVFAEPSDGSLTPGNRGMILSMSLLFCIKGRQ